MKKYALLAFFASMTVLAISYQPENKTNDFSETEISEPPIQIYLTAQSQTIQSSEKYSKQAEFHSLLAKCLLEFKVQNISNLSLEDRTNLTGTISLLFDKASEYRIKSANEIGKETGVINNIETYSQNFPGHYKQALNKPLIL